MASRLISALRLIVLFCLSVFLFLATSASAVEDKQWEPFWSKFKTALQKNDTASIASMTKLPYKLDLKDLNREQFIQKCSVIFSPGVRKCMLKEKPQRDRDSYMLFCGEEIYIFAKSKGKFLFTEISAND